MNRASAPIYSDPAPETPWPVVSKNLRSNRERSLYQALHELYPNHHLFVQVALSQLIDVPEAHPERQSIRNRSSQLVADFVLYQPDMKIIAVIELDDGIHEHAARKAADARKTKALADAGLRLVRIPAGPLPSATALQHMIEESGGSSAPHNPSREPDRPARLEADPLSIEESANPQVKTPSLDREPAARRAVRVTFLRSGLVVLGVGLGWIFYSQLIPPAVTPTRNSPASIIEPAQSQIVAQRRARPLAAVDLKLEQERAWIAYYKPPASCARPVDWNAQVECGNNYIRAKKAFEEQWSSTHSPGGSLASAVVPDNRSAGK